MPHCWSGLLRLGLHCTAWRSSSEALPGGGAAPIPHLLLPTPHRCALPACPPKLEHPSCQPASPPIPTISAISPNILKCTKIFLAPNFRIRLAQLMAEESGLTVDLAGFQKAMEDAKELSRQSESWDDYWGHY